MSSRQRTPNPQVSTDQSKAFDFASGITKLLISLATGVITISITFGSNYLSKLDEIDWPCGLLWTWIFLALSLLSGILALMAMTGVLSKNEQPNIYSCNIRLLELFQILLFLTGLVFAIIFTYKNITKNQQHNVKNVEVYKGELFKTYKNNCNSLRVDTTYFNMTRSIVPCDSLNNKH